VLVRNRAAASNRVEGIAQGRGPARDPGTEGMRRCGGGRAFHWKAHKRFPRCAASSRAPRLLLGLLLLCGTVALRRRLACSTLPPTYISWDKACTRKSRFGVRATELSWAEHVLYGKSR